MCYNTVLKNQRREKDQKLEYYSLQVISCQGFLKP